MFRALQTSDIAQEDVLARIYKKIRELRESRRRESLPPEIGEAVLRFNAVADLKTALGSVRPSGKRMIFSLSDADQGLVDVVFYWYEDGGLAQELASYHVDPLSGDPMR